MQQQLYQYNEKLKQFHSNKCTTFQKIKGELKSMIDKIKEEEENIFKLFEMKEEYQYSEEMKTICNEYKQTIQEKEDEIMKTLSLNKMEYDKMISIFDDKSLKTIDQMQHLLTNMDSIMSQIDSLLQSNSSNSESQFSSIHHAQSLQQKLTQLITGN